MQQIELTSQVFAAHQRFSTDGFHKKAFFPEWELIFYFRTVKAAILIIEASTRVASISDDHLDKVNGRQGKRLINWLSEHAHESYCSRRVCV